MTGNNMTDVTDVTDDTATGVAVLAERVLAASPGELADPLRRLLGSADVAAGLGLCVPDPRAVSCLASLLALDMDQGGRSLHKDNLSHTIRVVEKVPRHPRLVARFAALCHDFGKPLTRRIAADGTVTFRGHEQAGVRVTSTFLLSAGFGQGFADEVNTVILLAGRLAADGVDDWSDSAVRRFVRDAGDSFADVLLLAAADCTSARRGRQQQVADAVARFERRAGLLRDRDVHAALRPVLNGADVMRLLGLEPGPEVGEAMAFLRERFMGPDADRSEASLALQAWWAARVAD